LAVRVRILRKIERRDCPPCFSLLKDNAMAIPTMKRKNGITKSAMVIPFLTKQNQYFHSLNEKNQRFIFEMKKIQMPTSMFKNDKTAACMINQTHKPNCYPSKKIQRNQSI
jgi:RNase P subunit RPR2